MSSVTVGAFTLLGNIRLNSLKKSSSSSHISGSKSLTFRPGCPRVMDGIHLCGMPLKAPWPSKILCSIHLPTGPCDQLVRMRVDDHMLHDLPFDVLLHAVAVLLNLTFCMLRSDCTFFNVLFGEARQLRRPLEQELQMLLSLPGPGQAAQAWQVVQDVLPLPFQRKVPHVR